ncbi:MAG: hypothetical protein ACRD2L_19090, partial [Terriglobia bacterium]
VYFNSGWEFSNGCTLEYLVGLKAGLPLLDHENKPLDPGTAKRMIWIAIESVERDGFSAPELRTVHDQLGSP